jgi:hypothetical protein
VSVFVLVSFSEFSQSLTHPFIDSSQCHTMKLKIMVHTIDFNPLAMLLTRELAPVAIGEYPAVQQAIWLYNPYACDIRLALIGRSETLMTLTNDCVVVKSGQHAPIFLTFTPRHIGRFDVSSRDYFLIRSRRVVKMFGSCSSGLCSTAASALLTFMPSAHNAIPFGHSVRQRTTHHRNLIPLLCIPIICGCKCHRRAARVKF